MDFLRIFEFLDSIIKPEILFFKKSGITPTEVVIEGKPEANASIEQLAFLLAKKEGQKYQQPDNT